MLARADDARAVVITGDVPPAVLEHVRAELAARGFSVVGPDAADSFSTLATLHFTGPAPDLRAELRTSEQPLSESPTFVIVASPADSDEAFAVRTAETLRALLGPTSSSPAPAAPATLPVLTATTTAGPRPSPPPWSLSADAALLLNLSHSLTATGLALGARRVLSLHFDAAARLFIPVVPATLERTEGSATLDPTWLGLDLAFVPFPSARDGWMLTLAAGAGVAWLRFTGLATAPFVGRRASLWAATPYASVELRRALGARIGVRASLTAAVAVPPTSIRFAGDEVARWGAPLMLAAVGVDVGL